MDTVTVRMLADRQGWFWKDALHAGQVVELPQDVADYLVGLNVAVYEAVKAAGRAKKTDKDE